MADKPKLRNRGAPAIAAKTLDAIVADAECFDDSGTAVGTVISHVTPESAGGGPRAIVETSDEIALDGLVRSLNLLLSDQDIAAGLAQWRTGGPSQPTKRGYYRRFVEHMLQADKGCERDFLVGGSGSTVVRKSH